MIWKTTVSSKGQLTIPKPVREALKLKPGTKVLLTLREGKVELEPVAGDIQQWRGSLQAKGPALLLEEVREQVHQAIAEEVVREMQGN